MRWWMELQGRTYREAVFPDSDTVPQIPIPEERINGHLGYPEEAEPVFIGHYWLPDSTPRNPLTPNVACLDYSVAKGGRLTAYRWEGEQVLRPEKFKTANL